MFSKDSGCARSASKDLAVVFGQLARCRNLAHSAKEEADIADRRRRCDRHGICRVPPGGPPDRIVPFGGPLIGVGVDVAHPLRPLLVLHRLEEIQKGPGDSELRGEGQSVNSKRVQRRMRKMGIAALGPKPRTTTPAPGHKIFPYLLRNLAIERANPSLPRRRPGAASSPALSSPAPAPPPASRSRWTGAAVDGQRVRRAAVALAQA
jgi:hypothetical protein